MSFALIWERIWWSLMIAIFILLMWLRFIDPVFPHIVAGFILSIAGGGSFFTTGIIRMVRQEKLERELEEAAYLELMEELAKKEVQSDG